MKNTTKPAIILTVTILFILSIVGCEEERQLTTSKKTRLIANENMNLKEQLQGRDIQIKELQAQLQMQKDLLEKCQQKYNSLRSQKQREGEELMKMLLMTADTEKQGLKNQIKSLKEKIKQLEANK
ncbi:hypothetical protein ACFL3G_09640 [Planctomycetota bacterium]